MFATAGLVLVSLLGCVGSSPTAERIILPDPEETSTATASPSVLPSDTPLPIELEPQATKLPPALTLVPQRIPTVAPDPITGQVPQDLLDAIVADAQDRTGLPRAQIRVIRAEAVTWRDGSLGCPQPGMEYTQALVPGYWVVLGAGDETLDYHASEAGAFILCAGELAPAASPPMRATEELALPTSPTIPTPASAGLQQLVAQAKEDLALRLSIPTTQIDLFELSAVVWPDASLGCPQPGMDYKQVPQDGALILLTVEDRVYEYHSGGGRDPFLCEPEPSMPKPALPQLDIVPTLGSEGN